MPRALRVVLPTGLLILGLSACAHAPTASPGPESPAATAEPVARSRTPEVPASPPTAPSRSPEREAASTPAATDVTATPDREPRMQRATMRIPAIGVAALPVVPYRGSPDDGPGTRIQNGGVAASPFGARGGVGPGQVGNYIVTAHRTTEPAPFADLPSLRRGDHVLVSAGGQVFDYRVTTTRSTSFRSRRSLARQAAAVPGRPGVPPTRAMVTLSTCATPEDHARGNYWADRFGNPEHRIDKIGVLVGTRPARNR